LYTDLTFPLVAQDCVGQLTDHWKETWAKVSVMGPILQAIVGWLKFWVFAAICVGFNVLITGISGMISICAFENHSQFDLQTVSVSVEQEFPRISGEDFFTWAGASETAMMPSVTLLCEEMADQRRYGFHQGKDARAAMQARYDSVFGKINKETAIDKELADKEQNDFVMSVGRRHYVRVLFARVFLGNVLSMWLQASFFALTFHHETHQGRIKLVFSMVVSAIQATLRCHSAVTRGGTAAALVTFLIFIFIAWTGIKVFMAFHCADHLWNLTTGCVRLAESLSESKP